MSYTRCGAARATLAMNASDALSNHHAKEMPMTTPRQYDDHVQPPSNANPSGEAHARRVADVMTREVQIAHPDHSIQQAAGMMAGMDAGVLPVVEDEQLVGIITDRDIALRAVAHGKAPQTSVREVMSGDVRYCYEDQDTAQVIRDMAGQRLRRLPVLDRGHKLVGMLSMADLVGHEEPGPVGEGLAGISRSGGAHSREHTPH
jgi:CBS domain-containing protein